MKKIIVLIVLMMICPLILTAEQDELFRYRGNSGNGADFINSIFNPYGASVGGILTIFGNTADAVFWNPAGLTQIENAQLQFSGAQLSYDRVVSYASFAKPYGEDNENAFAVTVLGSYVDDIAGYDEYDNYLKKFTYTGGGLILSFAKPMSMVKFGVNLKVLNEVIDEDYAWGGAMDFGFLITPPLPVFLGINIKNLPGFIKWDKEKEVYSIGSGYQIGFGYKSLTDSMKIGLVFSKDQGDEEVSVNIGGEVSLATVLALRFGFLKGNFGGGLGIDLGFLNIDYAFYNEQFIELNNSAHMISTRFNF
ncbi:MAG: hypothetical protein KKH98_10500 [Spirochaetes bacterium]|nr:hypothetical protein [Spirochaetota bacterium]